MNFSIAQQADTHQIAAVRPAQVGPHTPRATCRKNVTVGCPQNCLGSHFVIHKPAHVLGHVFVAQVHRLGDGRGDLEFDVLQEDAGLLDCQTHRTGRKRVTLCR